MATPDPSKVFSMVAMPTPDFIRRDRFEPISNGYIYIGKTDTDPEDPANQVPVFAEQEDGSLVQVSQPLRISVSGYPVYNGKESKFVTQSAASMKVLDSARVQQWYWPNLFVYDPAQMWNVLTSSFGAGFVGTTIPLGSVQDQLNGYVTPWNFIGKAPYATEQAAIQAMFDYAAANNKLVWAVGATLHTNGILTAHDIKIVGGTWILAGNDPRFTNCEIMGGRWENRSMWLRNTTIRDCWLEKCRMRHDSGDVRILNNRFNGEVAGSNTASIVIQGSQPGADDPDGTIEVDGCIFTNGLMGVLHQGGHSSIHRAAFRNLAMYDMKGDGIELNVVNGNYEGGCVIENILLSNIDGINPGSDPNFKSNWGIGIGVAGKGPYGWDQPDGDMCANFTIRNVFAERVRQCIHVEMGRDFTIENVRVNPDITVSTATGLTVGGVYIAGSKDFVIDGVSGETVGNAQYPANTLPLVDLRWGTVTSDVRLIPACRNYTIRNVQSKNGNIECSVDAYPGFGTLPPYENRVTIENISCDTFSALGIATHLNLSNINCRKFDCWGDLTEGGHGASSGLTIATRSVLDMINVNAYDDAMNGSQFYNRCKYSNVNRIGGNVQADSWTNIAGSMGAQLATVGRIFYPQITIHGGDASFFPCGREFEEGDLVFVGASDLKPYVVTAPGAYFPTDDRSKVHAAAAGATQLVQFLTPNGTSTGSPWLYTTMLSPGTRIVVPLAAGGTQTVTVMKSPYQTPPGNSGAPITIDISPALTGAVADGAKITMAQVIQTRPAIPANSP